MAGTCASEQETKMGSKRREPGFYQKLVVGFA